MRQRSLLFLLAVLILAAFFAGRLAHRSGGESSGPGERQVLYYVDPMNPSFRSPEPGTAPCGMPLEPVYADGQPPGAAGATPSGAVTVRADRVQLIGVSREPVHSSTLRTTLRLVGTVAADETRLYWVTSATTGRVREMGTATTGSLVAKGEVLGAYYTSELLVPQQNFLRMHETYQSVQQGQKNPYDHFEGGNQLATYWRNVDVAREALMNLGMSSEQIDEITVTHQPSYLVQMRAPAAGVVLSRNVSVGQAFDEWAELFTIADLGSVWVLADAFEGQEGLFKPGARAVVEQPGAGRRFSAVVSAVPPRFEAATQTLKVRLDVVNPGLILRPDMLVDVELPVEVGPALFVPKEAVLDSGTRRIVFVEQGEGVFVPRPVRTGRRVGERVEIVGGLMEGETVVTSGNFLLDSESRMRAAGAAAARAVLDPICGMEVQEAQARARGLVSEQGGTSWFFCTPGCKQTFDRDPQAAAARAQGVTEPLTEEHRATSAPAVKAFHAQDPVCGMDVDPDEAARLGLMSAFQGAPFSFCSPACKREFDANPDVVLSRPPKMRSMPAAAGGRRGEGQGGMSPSMSAPMQHPQPMPAPMSAPMQHPQQMPAPMSAPMQHPQQMPGSIPAAGSAGVQTPGGMGAHDTARARDPFCRKEVDVAQARAAGLFTEFDGVTWYFDAEECKAGFDAEPGAYTPMVR